MEQIPSPKAMDERRNIERHLRRSVDGMILSGLDRESITWLLSNVEGIDSVDAKTATDYMARLLQPVETRRYHEIESLAILLSVQRALTKVSSYIILLEMSTLHSSDSS